MSADQNKYNIQGYNLVTLLKRLEAATSRLEDVTIFQESSLKNLEKSAIDTADTPSGSLTEGTTKAIGSAPSVPSTPDSGAPEPNVAAVEIPKSIKAFDDFISYSIDPFVAVSEKIDAVVGKQAQVFKDAFIGERKFLLAASLSKEVQPTDPVFGEALSPISTLIGETVKIKDENRKSPFFNNLNTVAEGVPVLGWVVTKTPVSFIPEYKDSSLFWANRILKEFKDKDESQVEWVKSFLKIFDDLKAYTKEYHTTGPTWNPQGGSLADALQETSASAVSDAPAPRDASAAPAPAAGGPPPPPPPPPASVFETSSAPAQEVGMNAVFSALNQGEKITSGLKKVDRSQMTHKNPELRASSQVPAKRSSPVPPKKPTGLTNKKPAKKELIDTKWLVENFDNPGEVITIEGEMHQSIFIGKCSNTVVQVKGKVNAISISECKKVGLVVDQLVSGVDVIKCSGFEIQVVDKIPLISIDKSDGGQIYLSKSSLDVEIYTSSTTALNVNVPTDGEDLAELPIPEQFKHTFGADGKITSTIVEHAG
ncbi:unnamed protein product [Kuraishia capsulata CBS 1993]|uniref:Adenylyl cyclase-associated protein n=1 Tax=Kuraishia capsulata CBS 1993 TaxID=1382522 RepID=W6MXY0_9ASCO|nr:uncharacterized protein KUCA_T00005663001 [Kuraishia capsulata CBS 1993]CDK29670.1 unnamed protein product [Kuraishia capsulata CBS 1993]